MRALVTSGVLLLIIIIILLCAGWYLNSTSSELLADMERTIEYVENDSWNEAKDSTDRIMQQWIHTSGRYQYMIHHNEIDAVSTALERLRRYIQEKNKTDSLAEASVLRFLFEHLPKKNALTGGNVF